MLVCFCYLIFDFFGQLDVLVAPFSKAEQKFLEQIEPKMLVTFAPTGSDLADEIEDLMLETTDQWLAGENLPDNAILQRNPVSTKNTKN